MATGEKAANAVLAATTLDPLIHEAARLKVMTVLSDAESADFNYLLVATGLTRGNLSTHMAKLVNGGYVEERKEFIERKPHTEYLLTRVGRNAYRDYITAWRRLTAI
jgi:DNA-binding HxlR family transcriptional regulator